jgi:acyl-CoA synthetase (AMP-forming)/AMP-acid ligase II
VLLHEILEARAAAAPDAPAVVLGGIRLSFGQLLGRARQLACAFSGITEPGDRIAVVGENDLAWVESYYGVPMAGRILVCLNHRLAVQELATLLERSGAAVLIGPAHLLESLKEAGSSLPSLHTVLDREGYEELVARARPDAGDTADLAGDRSGQIAWLIYTSGTTGSPKGVMLTHSSLIAASRVTALARSVAPDDVYVFAFPFCHVAGYNLLTHHLQGRPVVVLPKFEPRAFIEAVQSTAATSTSLAATMLSGLLDELKDAPLRPLRQVAYGAAPMPVSLMRRAHEQLGVDLAQGYGMTELSGNAAFLDPTSHRRGLAGETELLRAAGWAGPGVSLRVVDEQDRELPRGRSGEIVVRGPQLMAGYWEDPEGTAEALRGGWLHTGDIGYLGEDGLLFVVDRKKDVIVTGGENVSSREVEQVLESHPAIREVAVIGVPDPRWGENVCAVVVPRAGASLSPSEVASTVAERLAGFKKPRHVVMAESLPKSATGKVAKDELRRRIVADPRLLGERA